MKTLIIEDEQPAARQLKKLLTKMDPSVTVIETLDSVEASVAWLRTFPMPDVVFMDIQIADGLSFDIFNQVEITCPVVFTTAFDQYAIRAFKVNAIDYLLKPIDEDELKATLVKIQNHTFFTPPLGAGGLFFKNFALQMTQNTVQSTFKTRFLVKTGQNLTTVEVADIAYFFSEDGLTQLMSFGKKKHIVELSLNDLEAQTDPAQFFRINRNLIINLKAISKISPHLNGRLKLELTPPYASEVFVARERVNEFKVWLGG